MWCIAAENSAHFVCQMESVLEVYRRPRDPQFPLVCMDETTVQCIKDVRPPLRPKPGHMERYDVEYERNGVAHLLLFHAPLESWRRVDVSTDHTARTWAHSVRQLVENDFPGAERITLVMDNLNTHTGASLYKTFPPEVARGLMDRLELVYTPKHGSWLNIAECEFSVLARQCLAQRLPDIDTVADEIETWTKKRNQSRSVVDWHFTSADARIKLKRLYPKLSS